MFDSSNVKSYVKHIYGKDGKVAFTVAFSLDKNTGNYGTGIAVRSLVENSRRKSGHDKALGRSISAIANMITDDLVVPAHEFTPFVIIIGVGSNLAYVEELHKRGLVELIAMHIYRFRKRAFGVQHVPEKIREILEALK